LKEESGTRDSNPRLQPWQIGAQLKTKNNGAHGRHFESMNFTRSSRIFRGAVVNDVEMMYTISLFGEEWIKKIAFVDHHFVPVVPWSKANDK